MKAMQIACVLVVLSGLVGCAGEEARLMLAVSQSPERLAPEAAVQSGAGLSAFMKSLPVIGVSLVGLAEPMAFAYLAVHDVAQALNIGTAVVGKNDVLYIDARAGRDIEVEWDDKGLIPKRLLLRQREDGEEQ